MIKNKFIYHMGPWKCFVDDFEKLRVFSEDGQVQTCYRYNSGLNVNFKKLELKTSNKAGYMHGLHMYLYVPPGDFFNIHVGKCDHRFLSIAYLIL